MKLWSLDARLCGLTETILKSRMSENSPPENDGIADKRISGGDGKLQCPFNWFKQGGRDACDGTYRVHGIRDRVSELSSAGHQSSQRINQLNHQ